jgi:transposase
MLDGILTRQLYEGHGWRIAESRFELRTVTAEVRLEPTCATAVCSGCGETKRRVLDIKTPSRRWRHLDAWNVRTEVVAPLRRVRCRWCGIRVEAVPWARPGAHLTRTLESEILRRVRDCSIQGVCRQLGVHWTTVMRLVERRVLEQTEQRFRRKMRRIGVDEVSYGRGQQKYLTIVWDHDRSEVVWIGKGREQETLGAFFEKLGPKRSQRLEVVSMDMAQGYIAAVEYHAPRAIIVFDRFHIERHLTRAVNEVRKQEFWRRGGRYRTIIKGKKFLLLKKRRRLHWRRRRDLDALLKLNQRLCRAYVLKEQFDHAWTYTTERGMAHFLTTWRHMLRWTRLKPLLRFWDTIQRHFLGVTAWARCNLSNAALEGNNARVRSYSHRAHGYRNPDNMMLILYHSSWR